MIVILSLMKYRKSIFHSVLLLWAIPSAFGQSVHLPLKQVKREHRAAWRKIINWPTECEDAFQKTYPDTDDFGGLEFYRAGKFQYLVQITCYPGAYQPGSVMAWYYAKSQKARLLKFKGRESQDEKGKELPYSEINGFVTWGSQSQVLEIFSKSRGVGGCGFFGRYGFKSGQPILLTAREQDCEGTASQKSLNPRRWPRKKL